MVQPGYGPRTGRAQLLPRLDHRALTADSADPAGDVSCRWVSSARELTPSLAKAPRRWKATVREEIHSWLPTSLFDRPCATSFVTWSSIGVRAVRVDGSRLRALSPDARSSCSARRSSGPAPS